MSPALFFFVTGDGTSGMSEEQGKAATTINTARVEHISADTMRRNSHEKSRIALAVVTGTCSHPGQTMFILDSERDAVGMTGNQFLAAFCSAVGVRGPEQLANRPVDVKMSGGAVVAVGNARLGTWLDVGHPRAPALGVAG